MENTQPEKKLRAGAISATVWKNTQVGKEGKAYDSYSISLNRSYKDPSGSWKHATSFRVADLPKARLLIDKVYEEFSMKRDSQIEQ